MTVTPGSAARTEVKPGTATVVWKVAADRVGSETAMVSRPPAFWTETEAGALTVIGPAVPAA